MVVLEAALPVRPLSGAARANLTWSNVKQTTVALGGYMAIMSGIGGIAAATTAIGAQTAAAGIIGGVITVGTTL